MSQSTPTTAYDESVKTSNAQCRQIKYMHEGDSWKAYSFTKTQLWELSQFYRCEPVKQLSVSGGIWHR